MNRVTIIGHVVRDPEQTEGFAADRHVLHHRDERRLEDATTGERKQRVDFHTVTACAKLGDVVAQYVRTCTRAVRDTSRVGYSGGPVRGQKTARTTTEIVAHNLILLPAKRAA